VTNLINQFDCAEYGLIQLDGFIDKIEVNSHLAKKWTLPRGVLDFTKRILSSKTHFPENQKS